MNKDMPKYMLKDGSTTSNLVTYIIDIAGNSSNLAKLLNVSCASITNYEKRGYIPPIYASDIEEITMIEITAYVGGILIPSKEPVVTCKMICDEAKRFMDK